jgi:hypothetical protein
MAANTLGQRMTVRPTKRRFIMTPPVTLFSPV